MTKKNITEVLIHTDTELLKQQGFLEQPSAHEDCMRTSGGVGSYEWWGADAALEDGSTIAVVFYTKLVPDVDKPLAPCVQVAYTTPDGRQHNYYQTFDAGEFRASKIGACDVQIGRNYFRGGLDRYEIHVESEADGYQFDLAIERTTESWRPGWDGIVTYGSDFAVLGWFVAVPRGSAEAKIDFGDIQKVLNGSAYHDHYWGNIGLPFLYNHWHWARAEIGPYTVICSHFVCSRLFDAVESGSFIIAKDGRVIASRSGGAQPEWFLRSTPHVQPKTGKLISDVIRFVLNYGDMRYELALTRDQNVLDVDLTPPDVRGIAYLEGRNIGSHRMKGSAELKIYEGDCLRETQRNNIAVWEMTSFADLE
jgi:hypothetical protein